jgi:hypothetical protein
MVYARISIMFFLLPFDPIDRRALSSTHAGMAVLPFALGVGLLLGAFGGLADKFGARAIDRIFAGAHNQARSDDARREASDDPFPEVEPGDTHVQFPIRSREVSIKTQQGTTLWLLFLD